MADIVVVGFKDRYKADEALISLEKKGCIIDLEDVAVVVRNSRGEIKIKQTQNLVIAGIASGMVRGGFWGLLIGLLFISPLTRRAPGSLAGDPLNSMSDELHRVRIDDNFINELISMIQPGTSALFLLLKNAMVDEILKELEVFKGKILRTILSEEDVAMLRQAMVSKSP